MFIGDNAFILSSGVPPFSVPLFSSLIYSSPCYSSSLFEPFCFLLLLLPLLLWFRVYLGSGSYKGDDKGISVGDGLFLAVG